VAQSEPRPEGSVGDGVRVAAERCHRAH
jgi:hypothetical protein